MNRGGSAQVLGEAIVSVPRPLDLIYDERFVFKDLCLPEDVHGDLV